MHGFNQNQGPLHAAAIADDDGDDDDGRHHAELDDLEVDIVIARDGTSMNSSINRTMLKL